MPTKPDTRPICPIPDDAQVGDIVEFRNGQRKRISAPFDGRDWPVDGNWPGYAHKDGSAWSGRTEWEVVGFQYADGRKPNLPCTAKPKRTQAQRDGAWLRKFVRKCYMPAHETKRMLAIADRLEGKT